MDMRRALLPIILAASLTSAGAIEVCPDNPRLFLIDDEPTVLFGSGVWTIITDPAIDIQEHNEWYASRGANANRAALFAFCVQPDRADLIAPWERTGPGLARDGLPKFDLTRLDERFFQRLHEYLGDCQERGIVVLLQMFDEPYVEGADVRWGLNPFNPENNVSDLPGLPGGDGSAEEAFYNPDNAALMAVQEALILRLLDETAARYDNVIYEIGNEINMDSVTSKAGEWQQHWIDLFEQYEDGHPEVHLLLTNDTRPDLMELGRGRWGVLNHHGLVHVDFVRWETGRIVDTIAESVARDYDAYGIPVINSRPCSDPDRVNYPDIVDEAKGRAIYLAYLFSGAHVIGFRTTAESRTAGEAAERIIETTHTIADLLPLTKMQPSPDLIDSEHGLCLASDDGDVAVYLPLGGSARVTVAEGAVVRVVRYDPRRMVTEDLPHAHGPVVELSCPTSGEGEDWVFILSPVGGA